MIDYPQDRSEWTGSHIRFGSKADICAAKSHVRFTPESRLMQRNNACLLWREHCSGPLTQICDRRARASVLQFLHGS